MPLVGRPRLTAYQVGTGPQVCSEIRRSFERAWRTRPRRIGLYSFGECDLRDNRDNARGAPVPGLHYGGRDHVVGARVLGRGARYSDGFRLALVPSNRTIALISAENP
jgi:hypothetical protein